MLILQFQIRMRIRFVIAVCIALMPWFVFSQTFGNSVSYLDDEVTQKIEMEGFGYYGSNIMDIETMNLFYKGGYFNSDLKAESLKRLGANNLLGAEYGARITYLNPYVKWLDSAGIFVTYEISGGGGVSFSEDLFRLVFQGNQGYLGDSAFFSGTEFANYAFKKTGIGYNKGNKLKVGLSLLEFDNYSYGMVDRGIYYSDANSDSLTMRLAGNWMTDKREKYTSPVGFGMGMDFEVNLPYKEVDTMNLPRLVFGVKNLGLFVSSREMNVIQVDTLYQYTGTEVNNISDFQNGLYSQTNVQDSLLPQMQQGRKVKLLPFEMYFYSTSNPMGKKMQLIYGMRYKFRVGMTPQLYIGGDWRPSETTIITPFLSFGGYSYFKTGVSIRKQFEKLNVGLSFNNIPGFLTKEAYQRSMSISLSYAFK